MTCFPYRFIEFAKIKFEFIYTQCNCLEGTLSEHLKKPNMGLSVYFVFCMKCMQTVLVCVAL